MRIRLVVSRAPGRQDPPSPGIHLRAPSDPPGSPLCWAWLSLVGRLTVLILLAGEGLELQSFSY
eukprot:1144803-Pelagomonas_calceolata.AAC.1